MMMIDENIRETFDHANDAYRPMARSLKKKDTLSQQMSC